MKRLDLRRLALLAVGALVAACSPDAGALGDGDSPDRDSETRRVALGPVDGHDLAGADLDRIRIGDTAPDFSLLSYHGDTVTLSGLRGGKEVILVFYRGHW